MGRKYFGTDGIRGVFGGPLVNPEFFRRVGHALGHYLDESRASKPYKVVIGRDTRASGEILENAICEGFYGFDIEVYHAGQLPTPALAYLTRELPALLGVIITASHNLSNDNGVKLFLEKGLKPYSVTEDRIESLIDIYSEIKPSPKSATSCEIDGNSPYIDFISSMLPKGCLNGWKIIADTANGSSVFTTPIILQNFGANVITLGDSPDGSNINTGVGSENPEFLAEMVVAEGARLGIAHDGDGDRVIFCDENGMIISGEEIIAVLGLHALKNGKLGNNTVITTEISNLGLDHALEAAGGRVERVPVGDRNIIRKIEEVGYNFGGESSGHFILGDYMNTSDGLIAAVKIIELMLQSGQALSRLRKCIKALPQATASFNVSKKPPLSELPKLQKTIQRLEKSLTGSGRIIIRYSGTEPKIRLLVEGEKKSLVQKTMEALKKAVSEQMFIVS